MGRRSARFWSFAALSVAAVLLAPVTASAAPPACNPPSGYVANVQAGETITLPAPPCSDPDNDPVTIHPTQGPSHGTVDPSGDAPIGTRDYTADADAGGLDDVLKFVARANGEDSAEATLTIHIATNHAPVCPAHVAITVPMNQTFVISQSPCTDSDGDPLSFILVDPPDHGVVTGPAPNGSYSYTPEHDYAGADSLTYKAMDASAESNVGTLAITVGESNHPLP